MIIGVQEQHMPYDFRNKSFQKVLRGYSPEEVDDYIAYFNEEYKKLERRNADNERKLALAQKKIDEYLKGSGANTENALNQAREAAARILRDGEIKRDRIIAEAERSAGEKAAAILNEAAEKAGAIIESAEAEAELHRDDVRRMKKSANELYGEVNSFREKLFELYNAHLDTIDKITEASDQFISEVNVLENGGDTDGSADDSNDEPHTDETTDGTDGTDDKAYGRNGVIYRAEDDPTAFMDHLFSDPDESDEPHESYEPDDSDENDENNKIDNSSDIAEDEFSDSPMIDGTVYGADAEENADIDETEADIAAEENTEYAVGDEERTPVDIYIDPLDEIDGTDENDGEMQPDEENDFNRNDGFEEFDDEAEELDGIDDTVELDDSEYTELPPIGIDWKNKSAYDSRDNDAPVTEADDFKPADGFDADFGDDEFDDDRAPVLGESAMDPDFDESSDEIVQPDIEDFADEESKLDAIFEGKDKNDGEMSLTEEFNIIFSSANSKRNIEEIRKQPTAVPEAPKKQKKHQKNN